MLDTMSNSKRSVFELANAANAEKRDKAGKRRRKSEQEEEKADEASRDVEAIAKVVDRNIERRIMPVPAAAVDVILIDGKTMRTKMLDDRNALLESGNQRADPDYFGQVKKLPRGSGWH